MLKFESPNDNNGVSDRLETETSRQASELYLISFF